MDSHKLYMVQKRRLSALIFTLFVKIGHGSHLKEIGLFFQNALVDHIGVCTDTNYVFICITLH